VSSTLVVPPVGGVRPQIIRRVVDLPAPLGPRKPVTVPGSQRKRHAVHRELGAVSLAQVGDFDHGHSVAAAPGMASIRRRARRGRPRSGAGIDRGRWWAAPRDPTLDHAARGARPGGGLPSRRSRRDWFVDTVFFLLALLIGALVPATSISRTTRRSG
jgi:hypothetical protein